MSWPSRGTGTYDGALSASDKGDPLYDDIDEARADYASSKINSDTRDITMMPNVVYEARVDYASSKINADTRDNITMMPNVVYEARVDYATSKTDTKDIEMMPNAVYEKHTYK